MFDCRVGPRQLRDSHRRSFHFFKRPCVNVGREVRLPDATVEGAGSKKSTITQPMGFAETEPCGYLREMTKAFEADGFHFYIRNPPREHGPPHVHVLKGGTEVPSISTRTRATTWYEKVYKMRAADVVKAVRLVEANRTLLMNAWREIHG